MRVTLGIAMRVPVLTDFRGARILRTVDIRGVKPGPVIVMMAIVRWSLRELPVFVRCERRQPFHHCHQVP